MTMLSFECDYNNGAHPLVLRRLFETNGETSQTYGADKWSRQASEKIRQACECPEAEVFFLAGGTQTNAVVIDSLIRSHEAVIAAETAHINVHEAGAIEACGHRVIALRNETSSSRGQGLLTADVLERYLNGFKADESRGHVAQPGMVYITFPSELGTIYKADELEAVYQICRQEGLPLFIDGARMGYGLAASPDITLPWLARHCDAFYIGGTKVGALCGEAVVFPRGGAPKGFFSNVKRHGALLAKGRLCGIQFDALFTPHNELPSHAEPLYIQISAHAVRMAHKMKDILQAAGLRIVFDSPTNQQFVIIDNQRIQRLRRHVDFTLWEPYDDNHTLCRFVTSWATTDEDLEQLRRLLSTN